MMKPIQTKTTEATGYKEVTQQLTEEEIRDLWGDDPDCLVMQLLERLIAAESALDRIHGVLNQMPEEEIMP